MTSQDTSKFGYLRYRPFLVIDLSGKPVLDVSGKPTDQLDVEERPSVINRISDLTLRRATVIIDIINDRVIKNRLLATMKLPDDDVLAHYKRKYHDRIEQARSFWSMIS